MSSMCTCTPYLHLSRKSTANYVRRACDIPIWTERISYKTSIETPQSNLSSVSSITASMSLSRDPGIEPAQAPMPAKSSMILDGRYFSLTSNNQSIRDDKYKREARWNTYLSELCSSVRVVRTGTFKDVGASLVRLLLSGSRAWWLVVSFVVVDWEDWCWVWVWSLELLCWLVPGMMKYGVV